MSVRPIPTFLKLVNLRDDAIGRPYDRLSTRVAVEKFHKI